MEHTALIKKPSADGTVNKDDGLRSFTRREAVERQLEMAVRARLQFDDFVSASTLIGAAERVIGDLQPPDAKISTGYRSFKSFWNEHVKDVPLNKFMDQVRLPYDQLRHADKKPEWIHKLKPETIDGLLLQTIYAHAGNPPEDKSRFAEWFNSVPPVLGAFIIWMFLNDPRGEKWTRDLGNNPDELNKFKDLPASEAFGAILELVLSKSLIPNPKSLQEQAQP